MKQPLVTITIPTYNSDKFLNMCLLAVKNQSYKNIEVNIIDGGSQDNTIEIAKKNKIDKIRFYGGALLGARHEGVKLSEGKYILMLDSDQILEHDSIERSVKTMEDGFDMLIFEESVYKNETFLEHLFDLDRKLIHNIKDFNPYTGVMLPRFFSSALLKNVFSKISSEIIQQVSGQDHAIIYYEAWKISKEIGLLRKAVKHIEPDSILKLWKKFYRWGKTSKFARKNKYKNLFNKKECFRKGTFSRKLVKESIASILLLILKGVPYKLGVFLNKN